MKNYFIIPLLFLLLPAGMLRSQHTTLHVIYNVNSHEADALHIGCQKDYADSYELFESIGNIAREASVDLDVRHYVSGFSKEEIRETVNNIEAAENDAIIYLYSGHGELEDTENYWPLLNYASEEQMRNGEDGDSKLSLESVHEALMETDARMTISLGSACSNDRNETVDVAQLLKEVNENKPRIGSIQNRQENFKLFTNFEGHIIASGASPGQFAWLNDKVGSFFVATFLNSLVDGILSEEPTSWAGIFEKTKSSVVRQTKHHQKLTDRQVPQFQIKSGQED